MRRAGAVVGGDDGSGGGVDECASLYLPAYPSSTSLESDLVALSDAMSSLTDAMADAPVTPVVGSDSSLSQPSLAGAAGRTRTALEALGPLADADSRLDELEALFVSAADTTSAGAGVPPPGVLVDDADDLASYLLILSATAAAARPGAVAVPTVYSPLLLSPDVVSSVLKAAALVRAAPRLQRLVREMPTPGFDRLRALTATLRRQRSAARAVVAVLPLGDVLGSAAVTTAAAATALDGMLLDVPAMAGMLATLTRFRGLLPGLLDAMSALRAVAAAATAAGANATSAAGGGSTGAFSSQALAVVAAVNTAVSYVGSGFDAVPAALAQVARVLDALRGMGTLPLSLLAPSLEAALVALADLPGNADVAGAGVSSAATRAAALGGNASIAPRVLSALSALRALGAMSSGDLAPVRAAVDAVGTLDSLASTLSGLVAMSAGSASLRGVLSSVAELPAVALAGSVGTTLLQTAAGAGVLVPLLADLRGYLARRDTSGVTRLGDALAVLAPGADALPPPEELYAQLGAWAGLASRVRLLAAGPAQDGEATAAALAEQLARLLAVVAPVAAGATTATAAGGASLGVGASLAATLGENASSVMYTLDVAGALLRRFGPAAAALPAADVEVATADGADALAAFIARRADVRGILSRASSLSPRVLETTYASFAGGAKGVDALLTSGASFFASLLALNGTMPLLQPLVWLLGDAANACPAPQPAAGYSINRRSDALHCWAWANTTSTATIAPGVMRTAVSFGRTAQLDVARCAAGREEMRALGFGLSSVLPQLSASVVLGYTSVNSANAAWGSLVDSMRAAGFAQTSAPRVNGVRGLGFCFTPSIASGPCAELRTRLRALTTALADALDVVSLGEGFVVPALAAAFGPALRSPAEALRDSALPAFSSFYAAVGNFSAPVATAASALLPAVVGRRLTGGASSGAPGAYAAYVPELAGVAVYEAAPLAGAVGGSWRMLAQAGDTAAAPRALLSVAAGFVASVDADMAAMSALLVGTEAPLEPLAAACDAAVRAPLPVAAALAAVPGWLSRLVNASDAAAKVTPYLGLSAAVRDTGAAMFPIVTVLQNALAFLRQPGMSSPAQLAGAVQLMADTAALGISVSARFRELAPRAALTARNLYIHARGGFTPSEVAPFNAAPWCANATNGLCLRQLPRSPPEFLNDKIPRKYMVFWDLVTPTLANGGGKDESRAKDMFKTVSRAARFSARVADYRSLWRNQPTLPTILAANPGGWVKNASLAAAAAGPGGFVPDREVLRAWYEPRFADVSSKGGFGGRLSWTQAGLYDFIRPRGVGFIDDTYIFTCGQAADAVLLPQQPSMLVVYKRKDPTVYRVIGACRAERGVPSRCIGFARDYSTPLTPIFTTTATTTTPPPHTHTHPSPTTHPPPSLLPYLHVPLWQLPPLQSCGSTRPRPSLARAAVPRSPSRCSTLRTTRSSVAGCMRSQSRMWTRSCAWAAARAASL